MTNKDIAFGRRLRRVRKQIGFTQEELADKCNLSVTFIGLLEIGSRRPSLKTLQKVSTVLGVKTKDLIPY
jgi:transcriptional regulator with XRE-family HTH domain